MAAMAMAMAARIRPNLVVGVKGSLGRQAEGLFGLPGRPIRKTYYGDGMNGSGSGDP